MVAYTLDPVKVENVTSAAVVPKTVYKLESPTMISRFTLSMAESTDYADPASL